MSPSWSAQTRTAILYSPIDPAGEQGPLGTAPSAITPTHILPWALLLPQWGLTLRHLSPPPWDIAPGAARMWL